MNQRKAKALRKLIYKDKKFRDRKYYICKSTPTTILADELRQNYQKAKGGNMHKLYSIEKLRRSLKRTKLLDNIDYYWFYRCWGWINRIPLKIKSFFQRAKRGWADEDTWSFDYYLAKIISGGLNHLKKHMSSFPTWTPEKTKEETSKEWKETLDKIINAFKLAQKFIDGEIKCHEWEKKYRKEFEKGLDLFKEWFFAFWD